MAAAAAETRQNTYTGAEFGYTTTLITEMGRLAATGAGVELEQVSDELWRDFITGVQENVVISEQLVADRHAAAIRERLQFDPMRHMERRDGKIVTADGRTMESLCEKGVVAAKGKAAEDERMQSEVERSENDVWVARQVDQLKPGEMFAVVCMEPLEAMDRDGDEFWRRVSVIGYKRGLAVLQVYYGTEDGVLAGAYSIKGSNKRSLHEMLAEQDVEVPVDTPANAWIRHPIRRKTTLAEAMGFGAAFRARYQQIVNRHTDNISVTQLIADNEPLVRTYFDVYVKALAEANYTGRNNDTMRGMASALLGGAGLFGAPDRQAMLRIANSRTFGHEDTLFMEKTIRYACAEELWNILLQGDVTPAALIQQSPDATGSTAHLASLHARAAGKVHAGVALGRSGGGCSSLKFARPEGAGAGNKDDDLGQQDVYGGNANEATDETFDGKPRSCAYVHDQCYCSPYDDLSNPTGVRKLVVAYRDREGTATCQRPGCGACIDKDNNVLSMGGIYKRALKKTEERSSTETDKA